MKDRQATELISLKETYIAKVRSLVKDPELQIGGETAVKGAEEFIMFYVSNGKMTVFGVDLSRKVPIRYFFKNSEFDSVDVRQLWIKSANPAQIADGVLEIVSKWTNGKWNENQTNEALNELYFALSGECGGIRPK